MAEFNENQTNHPGAATASIKSHSTNSLTSLLAASDDEEEKEEEIVDYSDTRQREANVRK